LINKFLLEKCLGEDGFEDGRRALITASATS
jgi:hypothetical protein